MEMGKCVEESVEAYVLDQYKEEKTIDPVDLFSKKWGKFADNTEMVYSDDEGDWSTQLQVGQELMKLFKIRLPELPILNKELRPIFQDSSDREMFPGTALSGIEFTAKLDIISFADWKHPLLPEAEPEPGKKYRPVIIDMKVSGKMLKLIHRNMLILDQQLRAYSWMKAIPDVAFLWFAKAGIGFKSGLDVTLLESFPGYPAGTAMYVADTVSTEEETSEKDAKGKPKKKKTMVGLWLLTNKPDVIKALEDYCKGLTGKAYDTKYAEFLTNAGVQVPLAAVTRQRIQFFSARVPEEMAAESGRMIAQQCAEINDAAKRDFFPKQSGIRFPNDKCSWCDYRGICIGDDKLRDAFVWQPDEQFLLDLGEEEELVQIEGAA
jgi:hypothetical protein